MRPRSPNGAGAQALGHKRQQKHRFQVLGICLAEVCCGMADVSPQMPQDEFTFRFNRRTAGCCGLLFYRLLLQATNTDPAPLKDLVIPDDFAEE